MGAGIALGIAVGAGAALLAAPATGEETRAALRSRARRLKRTTTRRGRDVWDDLRAELEDAARALRRRKIRRARRHDHTSEPALE
jgi:gas vesicle protein